MLGIDVSDTMSAEGIIALADGLIDATHEAYEALLRMQREYRDGLEAAVAPYQEAVDQANDERLGEVSSTHPAHDDKPRITVAVELPDGIWGIDVENAINNAVDADEDPRKRGATARKHAFV